MTNDAITCRGCGERATYNFLGAQVEGGPFWRCVICGCDTSEKTYEQVRSLYDADYVRHLVERNHSFDGALMEVRANADWFVDHGVTIKGRDFLDVGHLDGVMLRAMAHRGWRVHGFDVIPEANLGPHTTIHEGGFRADLFPQQYHAVNCREVIEHVPDWKGLICEMNRALVVEGLLQVQTPMPWDSPHPIPYQEGHLVILSPLRLRYELEWCGFSILDWRHWDAGQAWMCRKTRDV